MEIIDKKEFVKTALDENVEAFIVYMTFIVLGSMLIHLARKGQIALLLAKEVKILAEYLDFLNAFLEKKALVLPELTKLNQHIIKLQDGKQLPYRPIYNRGRYSSKH